MRIGEIWKKHNLVIKKGIRDSKKFLKEHPEADRDILDYIIFLSKETRVRITTISKNDLIGFRLISTDSEDFGQMFFDEYKLHRKDFLIKWQKDWSFNENR